MTPATRTALLGLLSLGLATALPACGDGVVGGACADGYELCDGRCAPLGACTVTTPDGGGLDADGGPLDGGDAGRDATPAGDAGDVGEGGSDGSGSDGSGGDGGDGGSADAVDDADAPVVDTGPTCDGGLVACGGACVDTDVDPFNCGACGNVCPTGLCNGGKCRGAKAGHVVAIGHDYESTSNAVAGKPLANAAFLPTRNPVRLLVLAEFAESAALANVGAVLTAAGKLSGRTYVQTVSAKAGDFHDKLNIDAFDVALVLDQRKAPAGGLATTADAGKATYASFTKAGGVLVVLDGGAGTGEMPSFLSSGGLLGVAGHVGAAGASLEVADPADVVGVDVLSPYLAPKGTVGFTWTAAPDALARVVVSVSVTDAPVVLHRVVKP